MSNTDTLPRTGRPTSASRRGPIYRVGAFGLALAAMLLLAPTAAQAASNTWTGVPSYGGGTGSAIIDGHSGSSAWGRVQVRATSYCVKIQYAPYAIAALDGRWNDLAYNCSSNTTKVFYWSDSYRLAYDGFKFRICTTAGCGSSQNVRYW
ncbi:MAG: hypothetical protein JWR33_930 [Naasia sp.]|jgi:hypothetical protein|uniref:hypothetical protein n=1 Tax=Naasia sp. TaxID=2546198 RepID=UPI00260327B7|nr:hypothetical protein [Naasia sp.]MCU1570189.1 hypothetical protein [Naasia sp.]